MNRSRRFLLATVVLAAAAFLLAAGPAAAQMPFAPFGARQVALGGASVGLGRRPRELRRQPGPPHTHRQGGGRRLRGAGHRERRLRRAAGRGDGIRPGRAGEARLSRRGLRPRESPGPLRSGHERPRRRPVGDRVFHRRMGHLHRFDQVERGGRTARPRPRRVRSQPGDELRLQRLRRRLPGPDGPGLRGVAGVPLLRRQFRRRRHRPLQPRDDRDQGRERLHDRHREALDLREARDDRQRADQVPLLVRRGRRDQHRSPAARRRHEGGQPPAVPVQRRRRSARSIAARRSSWDSSRGSAPPSRSRASGCGSRPTST